MLLILVLFVLSVVFCFSNHSFIFLSRVTCLFLSLAQNNFFLYFLWMCIVWYKNWGWILSQKELLSTYLWWIMLSGIIVQLSILFFRTQNAFLQALRAFTISVEISAAILMGFPSFVTYLFFFYSLQYTFLFYIFNVLTMICYGMFMSCLFGMSFPSLREFFSPWDLVEDLVYGIGLGLFSLIYAYSFKMFFNVFHISLYVPFSSF